MEMAVGVGRPVVKNIGLAAFACLPKLFVETELFPARQQARLELRQPRLHWKICLW
ncbi:hypothetical protein MnTg02_00114 [bacterium MnTg02]|nr:hypothetical protein MnTg02_00114 [bacterium MnTg02]